MDFNTFLRYKGFLKTPQLWHGDSVFGLNQFSPKNFVEPADDNTVFKNARLGKLVEEFVFHQLKQQEDIEWIADNLQIQNGKQTIGELDAIFNFESKPVHLEVVYKFYLYDTLETYNDPLAYWIGPNRKDTLIYKLEKLKHKQLPLLFNRKCKPYLDQHSLTSENLNQFVTFKAQLFLPYNLSQIQVNPLNKECISGFHLPFQKIELLNKHQFYIPNKLDWLVIPHNNVDWQNYETTRNLIEEDINSKRSPMLWIKDDKDQIKKGFITFW